MIGILGCHSGAGVTHLAAALCSYCVSKKRKKAAYLELHDRNEIIHILPEAELVSAMRQHAAWRSRNLPGEDSAEPFCFSLHGVDCYPHVSGNEVPKLLNRGYDYLILDLGSRAETDLSEFLRCDRKLILGSTTLWKAREYETLFEHLNHLTNLGEGYHYLVQMGTSQNISRFSREHHVRLREVPFIKNPYRIEKELFRFFEELLAAYPV